jgi:hypothetical protein
MIFTTLDNVYSTSCNYRAHFTMELPVANAKSSFSSQAIDRQLAGHQTGQE